MDVRTFIDLHFSHFNSRELRRSAQAYETHIKAGGKMMVSLAGAMSTARVGRILSRAIRADLVHAVSCTGANLEEDAFCLVAGNEYEEITNWRALQAEDELALYQRGMNRVTDTCIPETVMRHLEDHLLNRWRHACAEGRSELPSTYLLEAIKHPDVVQHHQAPEDSWLLAAHEKNIPIFTPGWEDSTLGNAFAAMVYKDKLPHHNCVITGTEQMILLMDWYRAHCQPSPTAPSVGFFQIGGGIAGDFAICAVPALIQDVELRDTPFWGYFCQISDAVTSYGGYSGAVPNEKITWGKLETTTPKYMIESDATIVAPLIFAYLLGD